MQAEHAQLVALEKALDSFISSRGQVKNQGFRPLMIYCDSKSALHALSHLLRQIASQSLRAF